MRGKVTAGWVESNGTTFYASATVEKRSWGHSIIGFVFTRAMHLENLVNTISQKPIKGISPNLVTDVFGFIDVRIRFWGQKVTAGNGPHNGVDAISM